MSEAIAKAGNEKPIAVEEAPAEALGVLAGLSSYLGAGLGDDATTAAQYDARIRLGIDNMTSATVRRCADVVERLSRSPGTRWGEVKAAILALAPDAERVRTAPEGETWLRAAGRARHQGEEW